MFEILNMSAAHDMPPKNGGGAMNPSELSQLSGNIQRLNSLGLRRLADMAEVLAGVPAYTDPSGKIIPLQMGRK